jgi:hypothetical protein
LRLTPPFAFPNILISDLAVTQVPRHPLINLKGISDCSTVKVKAEKND